MNFLFVYCAVIGVALGLLAATVFVRLALLGRAKRLSPGAPTAREFAGAAITLLLFSFAAAVVALGLMWFYGLAIGRHLG